MYTIYITITTAAQLANANASNTVNNVHLKRMLYYYYYRTLLYILYR